MFAAFFHFASLHLYKRKINEKNGEFNKKWTFNYFFTNSYSKTLCLICK